MALAVTSGFEEDGMRFRDASSPLSKCNGLLVSMSWPAKSVCLDPNYTEFSDLAPELLPFSLNARISLGQPVTPRHGWGGRRRQWNDLGCIKVCLADWKSGNFPAGLYPVLPATT